MNINSIDYNRTITQNKLNYKGQQYEMSLSIIVISIICFLCLSFLQTSFEKILNENPRSADQYLAFIFPIIVITIGIYMVQKVLRSCRLKEIKYVGNFREVKNLIIETATIINWKLIEKNDKLLIFYTDPGPIMDKQIVTIIIHPEKKILFNCIEFSRIHFRITRFNDNYMKFQENFKKLIENKTAGNNGYHK